MKIKNFIVKNKKQISIYIYIYILLNFIIKSLNLILKKKKNNIFFISISINLLRANDKEEISYNFI